ncbi:MAG TPA: tetratricopeptide repeat protein, partial [Candidatus Acidoferrum sp.]|nr:tetratricopeptide repeat protein [Candidatus Acidoferrum sp.]
GDPRTETMNVLCRGTPCYMSPEQARGEKLDRRSDLFSLGAVLYECLTGRRAFPGHSAVSALVEVVSGKPPAPSTITRGVSPRLDDIVRRLLEKDRAARYGSAAELAADLRALESAPAPVRWRRAMLPVAATCAVLIAGAVTLRTAWKSPAQPAAAPVRQVVVLPFANEGPPAQAAFGDGVTEVVTGMVANLSDNVWAVPAVDVRRYGVQTPADAKRTFHADLAISGSVRREASAGAWAVTLRLSDASSPMKLNQRTVRVEDSHPGAAEPALREALSALLQAPARRVAAAPQPQLNSYSRFVAARGLLRQYDRGDNLKNAVAELQKITDVEPSYAPAQVALGEACFRMFSATKEAEWLARADQAVRRAAEINENEPGIHVMLGRILRATGQTDAAIAELKTALAHDPGDVLALFQLAGAYDEAKRPADAEEAYRRTIRLRPSYFPAYMNLGGFYMRQGKWQQAEEPLTLVTRLAPDHADGYDSLGALEYYLDRLDEAKRLFTRSIELKPGGSAYANRCGVEFDLRDMVAAGADCRKAVELQPANPLAWGNLADVLAQSGQTAEAATSYTKAIELGNKQLAINPANADLLGVMSKCAAKIGQKQLALELAGKAIAQSSAVRVLYNAGKTYGLSGDCTRSSQLLKQAFDNGYPRPEAKKDPDLDRLRAAPLSCAVPPI